MTDEELIALNRQGFIPGPEETEEKFLSRVHSFGSETVKITGFPIPEAHWKWVRRHLVEIFDFEPRSLPAFYSNRLLTPWQGAASWILDGKLIGIQLREKLKEGSYLGIYDRDEILAHEAVHAARCAFEEKENEEFFAYLTSSAKWRRAIGPILRSPWEAWPFILGMVGGLFFLPLIALSTLWLFLGCIRLIRQHRILAKASQNILKWVKDAQKTRAILLRLTDQEIRMFAKIDQIREYAETNASLRWKLIRLAYLRGICGEKNHC